MDSILASLVELFFLLVGEGLVRLLRMLGVNVPTLGCSATVMCGFLVTICVLIVVIVAAWFL